MKKLIILFILFIITSIISISVTSEFKQLKKEEDANKLYISKVVVDGVDKSKEIISDDKKSMLFMVNDLKNKDDKVSVDYEIFNNSKSSFLIDIKCETSFKYKDYYNFDNNYERNIDANKKAKGNFELILIKDSEIKIKEIVMCNLSFLKK